MIELPSPNFDARTARIELVVLHYTGMQDAETALRRLTDPAPTAGAYPGPWQAPDLDPTTALGRASAHYVVDESGRVHRLVGEEHRAWHAGAGVWEGREDLNSRSIGIEIVNGGHDFGLPPFPDVQIAGVIALLEDVLSRHELGPHRVIGHSDLAPQRKADPGERFPWEKLAEAGVSIWPETSRPQRNRVLCKLGDTGEAVHDLHAALAAFGYAAPEDVSPENACFTNDTQVIVTAFQRRFFPQRMDGVVREEMRAALDDLLEQIAELEDE